MDDFSNPGIENTDSLTAAPDNHIEPGKQPLSSLSPTIIVDAAGDVRMLIGGAGGTKITTSVAMVRSFSNISKHLNMASIINKNTFMSKPCSYAIYVNVSQTRTQCRALSGICCSTKLSNGSLADRACTTS